jgi:FkbM family methyltransferase
VVIDVGANIGYLAMLFAYAVGPTGHVVAIEPGRRILPLLKRNTSQFKNIDVRDICASDQDGLVTFHESEMSDTSSMLSIANAVSYTVSATTLDKLVAGLRTQPSLVKIDVEGCEDRVLQGAANILARDNPPIVVFEALTFEARERCVKVFGQVVGNRYAIYRIQPDANLLPCESEHGTNDYLAVPDWAADRVRRAIPLAAEKMVQR